MVYQVYLSGLGLLSLVGSPSLSNCAHGHLSCILFVIWTVYVYRDIWPLATLDLSPADEGEGAFLWAKLSLLTISGIVIPLFVPRRYTPANPKVGMHTLEIEWNIANSCCPQEALEPNPEQTASIASLVSYSYLAPVVWLAYRMPHLPFEMFPPLSDYDHLRNLVVERFPVSDLLLRDVVLLMLTRS